MADPAAVELGRRGGTAKWRGVSKKERSRIMREVAKAKRKRKVRAA